jgi:hypothetical protein
MVQTKLLPKAGSSTVSLTAGNGTSAVAFNSPFDSSIGTTYSILLQNYAAKNATLEYNAEIPYNFELHEEVEIIEHFVVNAAVVATNIFSWIAPYAGRISSMVMTVGTTGTVSGATTSDVNIDGTTIFSVNPTVAYDAANGSSDGGTVNAAANSFAADAVISIDVDAIVGGSDGADVNFELTMTKYIVTETAKFEFIAPFAGTVKSVTLDVGTTGITSGNNIIDVNINGTTIFTTRPTVAWDDADGTANSGTIDVAADDIAAGDIISIDVDSIAVDSNDWRIEIVVEPSEEVEYDLYASAQAATGFTINIIGKSASASMVVHWVAVPHWVDQ